MKHQPRPHRSTPTPNSALGIPSGRKRIFSQLGAWEIVLAIILLAELAAIEYQARWVPFVRIQLKQAASKIESAIASRLGAASRYEDQHFSEIVPRGTSPISQVPAG